MGLVKTGTGTLSMSGDTANSWNGGLVILDGTVLLNKQSLAVAGTVYLGDHLYGSGTDALQIARPEQIADAAAINMYLTGQLATTADLAGKASNEVQTLVLSATPSGELDDHLQWPNHGRDRCRSHVSGGADGAERPVEHRRGRRPRDRRRCAEHLPHHLPRRPRRRPTGPPSPPAHRARR